MKLSISRSKNSIIYYVQETYRKGAKTSSRIVCKIGSHSELLEKGIHDPLNYAKEFVNNINKELKEGLLTYEEKINLKKELTSDSLFCNPTYKNIGWLVPLKIYNQLGIKEFIEAINTKTKFDINNIIKMLSISRILNPSSKKATFESIDKYLCSKSYNLIDSYRVLELLSKNNELLQQTLYNKTKNIISVNNDVFYYDCTNYYYESEEEDEDIFNTDGDIIQWGLRKYGVSKEHRPNPIVQMGLFINKDGIPISYSINPGNTNEQTTAIPLEKQMINNYKQSSFIYCSDAGLASYDIRFFNSLSNRHYVVTQSLKKIDKENSDYIFKDINWKFVVSRTNNDGINNVGDKVSLKDFKTAIDKKLNNEELTDCEKELLKRDMIYKVYPIKHDVPANFIKELGIKISGKLQMEELIYITFSQNYYIYQKQLFNKQLDRAKEIIKTNRDVTKRNQNSPNRFIDSVHITDSGEVASKRINDLDGKTIEKEEKYHGFYAIATNLDSNINTLLSINAQRWKIEQSFRILKSEFDARPAFVWNNEHIKGHFAICYIALLIYRIIERKLILTNSSYNFSSSHIIKTLNNMNVIEKGEALYQAIFSGSQILDALNKTFDLKLNKLHYKKKTLTDMFE